MVSKEKFDKEEGGDEEFGRNAANFRGECIAAGLLVRLDVHDFTEDMRVHGERSSEEKSLPRKLRKVVDPTAQDEDQKIAGLDEDIERRTAFERKRARVVDVYSEKNCGKPKYDTPSRVNPEKADERELPSRDLPAQGAKLFVRTARAEQVGPFAGIEAVALGVDNVIHAVKEKAEREDNVEEANPEAGGVEIENTSERHEVEEDCGGPEARTRDLEEKS